MKHHKPVSSRLVLLVSLIAFPIITYLLVLAPEGSRFTIIKSKDSRNYLTYAFNLAKRNAFSLDHGSIKNPSAYREPLYPTIVSLFIKSSDKLMSEDDSRFFSFIRKGLYQIYLPQLKRLIAFNFLIFILTGLLVSYGVHLLTKSSLLAAISPYSLILFQGNSEWSILSISQENITAFLLVLLSITLYKYFKKSTLPLLILACFLISLLTLTKAHFQYLIPISTFAFPAHSCILKKRKKDVFSILLVLLTTYCLTIGPWTIRNYLHFERIFISERSGLLLAYRCEYNKMTPKEYAISIPYFLELRPITKYLLSTNYFDINDISKLNRNNDTSYYQAARIRREEYGNKKREGKSADQTLAEDCLAEIKSNFSKHLLTSIPMALKGTRLFAERSGHFTSLKQIIYLFGFIILLIKFIKAIKMKCYPLVGILFPSAYNFLFMALLTHSIPRYNTILLPMILIFIFQQIYIFLAKKTIL